VAGPEASNNASAAGTLVPMLALGLPVSATAAVMLAAFQTYGIQPGPLLFEREAQLVWGLIASLFIGNVLLLVLNLPLAPIWAKLLAIPRPYLYAGILFFATLGAYSANAQVFDLVVLLVLGALGFAMRRYGLPVLPAIIGMILGPRAELQGRRALQISGGEISGLFNTPLAISIYCLIALVLLWPLINRFLIRRIRPRPDHAVHHGHTHALVELAEELAGDGEELAEQERVLARAERETKADDDRDGHGRRRAAGVPDDRSGTSRVPPDDARRE
jgi:putative tricarboxylic transport membrane protein